MVAKKETSAITFTKTGNVNLLNSDARGIFEFNITEHTKISLSTPNHLPAHRLISYEEKGEGYQRLKILLAKGDYVRCTTKEVFKSSDWSPSFSVDTAPIIVERQNYFKITNQSGRKSMVEVEKPEGARFSNVRYNNSMCSEVYKIVWEHLFKDFPMLHLDYRAQFSVRFIHGTRSMNELKALIAVQVEDDTLKTFSPKNFVELQGTGRLFLLQCKTGDFIFLSSDDTALKAAERKFVEDMEQYARVDLHNHGGSYSVFPALPSAILDQLNAPLQTVKTEV